MKIWSDTLELMDLVGATDRVNEEFPGTRISCAIADIFVGARKRAKRFDGVKLRAANGIYHPNTGTHGADGFEYAASWTEWGWWLARVFEVDPDAICAGAWTYDGADDFHKQTGQRFRDPRTPRERQLVRELRGVR